MFESSETFKISVGAISNHNIEGVCSEKTCNTVESHFMKVELYGIELVIGLCKRHYDLFEDKIFHDLMYKEEITGHSLEELYPKT